MTDATPSPVPAPVEPFKSAHDLCEASVDYVLANVNTVQYLIQSIEGITGRTFTRDRIKCLPAVPLLHQQRRTSVAPTKPPAPKALSVSDAEKKDSSTSAPSSQEAVANKKKPTEVAGGSALTLRPDQVFAGYMWRRARPDCEKGDIVLVEEHLPQTSGMLSGSGGADAKEGSTQPKSQKKRPPATQEEWLEQEYKKTLEQTERNIRHELIHAFDDARGFLESADCTHQACSEIRAARLSGDCFAAEEAKKGRFSFYQGGMQCVRRRATMAVEMNPVCRGFSERAVETVFPRCYSDYEPYVAPVYALGSYGDEKFENGTLKL